MTSLSSAQRRALGALLLASPFAKVARELGERFTDAGHQLYLVGGTVRHALLERSSPDVDFTTDADPTRILEIVKAGGWDDGVWLQGARFGTVGVRKGTLRLEITTFRSDVYHEDSRKPEVTFGRSIEEDLARRDFTVNAMAVRLPDGRFIDPFGGLTDLANRRLRTPSSPATSFEDDPLRMLRAARFAAALRGRACGWWCRRGSRTSSCRSCRRWRWSRTPCTATRTCSPTRSRWWSGRRRSTPTGQTWCCAWPRCCTTSASRAPAGWGPMACRSTCTRWSAPRWPSAGSRSCASPPRWSRTSAPWCCCTCGSTPTGSAGPTRRCGGTYATPGTCWTG